MKLTSAMAYLTLFSAAALLTGCVDPYYAGGTAVITTRRPGYVVTALPSGYRTEVIGGTRYYLHQDIYYRPQGRGYVVVESPHHQHHGRHSSRPDRDWDGRPGWQGQRDRGDVQVIRELPSGYQIVVHGGTRYYRAGSVYYQQQGDGYVIVRSPF